MTDNDNIKKPDDDPLVQNSPGKQSGSQPTEFNYDLHKLKEGTQTSPNNEESSKNPALPFQTKKDTGIYNIKVRAVIYSVIIVTAVFIGMYLLEESGIRQERKNQRSAPGDFSDDYLGNDYKNIHVEIDHVEGFEPDPDALEHFKNVIEQESGKSVSVHIDDSFSSSSSVYSLNDVNDLELKHRDRYTKDQTAVLYFIYLDGTFAEESTALGVSYHGSSMVMFIEEIEDAALGTISGMEIERAVLVHETGHLFGLVEINYKSEFSHQDGSHPHHCTHTNAVGHHDCVMYYAIESSSVTSYDSYYNQAAGDIPNNFCEYCRGDLEKLKS